MGDRVDLLEAAVEAEATMNVESLLELRRLAVAAAPARALAPAPH